MAMRSHRINQSESISEPVSKKGTEQWNLVVIAVDQLNSSQASLIGMWLLITSPGSNNLTIVPIYPTNDLTSGPNNVAWEEMFSLDSENTPSMEFLSKLSENLLWDEYLLVDKEGITNIVSGFKSTSPEIDIQGSVIASIGLVSEYNLDAQFEIWQAVCSELAAKSDPNEVSMWLDGIKPFTHTRFELKETFHQLNFQKNSQIQLECEFPTLALNTP